MSGWSGVALAGFGAGIGKSLEPENLAKVKETVNMLRWDDDLKKEKDSTNKNLTQSMKDYFNAVNPPPIVNPKQPAISTPDTASTQISITGVGASPPKPIEIDPTLTKLLNAEDALRVATNQNNPQKVQQYTQQVQDYQNQMNSNIQSRAIEAIQLQDSERFSKVIFDYYASKRQQVPEEYRRPAKIGTSIDGNGDQVTSFIFSGGVDSSGKPLPETSLTTLDLYTKFTGDLRAAISGSGSGSRRGQGTSGDSAFFAYNAAGEKLDTTSAVNGLMDTFNSSVLMRGKPENNDDRVAYLMDALTRQSANPKLMEMLQKTNIDVADLFKEKSLSRAILNGLRLDDGEGNVIFNNPSTEALVKNAIKAVSVTDADGVIKTQFYLDPSIMAQQHKGWLERVNQIKQDTTSMDAIKKSFDKPFPTSISNGTKEDVRKAQQQWFKDLSLHIMKTTDFQNMDVPTSYSIAQQIFDDYLRTQPESKNSTDSVSKNSAVEQSPSSSNEKSFLSSLQLGGKPLSTEDVNKLKGLGNKISDGLSSLKNNMWKDDPDRKPIGANPLYFRAPGDYNDARAKEAGIVPDENGKMGGVAEANKKEIKLYNLPPGSYLSLKRENHKTLQMSIDAEAKEDVYGGPRRPVQSTTNGEIFFIPKSAPLPPNMIDFKIKTPSSSTNSNQSSSNEKVPLSERYNNPGALEFKGQPGATNGGRFAKFKTPQEGFSALTRQIELDASRGHSLSSFLNKYAPKSENDTQKYIDFVSGKTGIGDYQKIAGKDTESIALAMTEFEGGKRALNYFTNSIGLSSKNASSNKGLGISNKVPPMAMMNVSGSKQNAVESMFEDSMREIKSIYNNVEKSLTPTGSKTKVGKKNVTATSNPIVPFAATLATFFKGLDSKFKNETKLPKAAIGKPSESSSALEFSSALRPLPAPVKFFLAGIMSNAVPGALKDFNFSNILDKTDVQALADGLKGRPLGKGGVEGSEWNNRTSGKFDLAMRQFSWGGLSYQIIKQDENGYPTEFIAKDTFDWRNKSRSPRLTKIEEEIKQLGTSQAFKVNFARALEHVNSNAFKQGNRDLYKDSPIKVNKTTELTSRALGEFFTVLGKSPSFDSKITVVYDKKGNVTDYQIKPIPIVRK
jgi:hypothetical protein